MKDAAQEKLLAENFVLEADRRQYGGMMTQLKNDYAKGHQN